MIQEYIYRKDFVLYFHRNKETKEVFYVGIGQERRAYVMTFSTQRNFLWKRYVTKHGKPEVEIYKSNLTLLEAAYFEQYFIKLIGRRIINTGNLVNLTKGGEGARPYKQPEEQVRKRVEFMKGFVFPKGKDHWAYGRVLTNEERKKISDATKGRKQTPEHIENRSAPRRGKRMNQVSIDKMAATLKGRKLPKEVVDKIGIASKKRWQCPEYKKRLSDAGKGKVRNSRKVIHLETGTIYNSAKEASLNTTIKQKYFTGMLGGTWSNKTGYVYLDTVQNNNN